MGFGRGVRRQLSFFDSVICYYLACYHWFISTHQLRCSVELCEFKLTSVTFPSDHTKPIRRGLHVRQHRNRDNSHLYSTATSAESTKRMSSRSTTYIDKSIEFAGSQ